jgi:hypothetical protein
MATGDNAVLTRASVSFHTNDEDKDDDSRVDVTVRLASMVFLLPIAIAIALFTYGLWLLHVYTSRQ